MNPDPSPPTDTIIPSAILDAYARRLHPRGVRGLPAALAMAMELPDIPPGLAMLCDAIADGRIRIRVEIDGVPAYSFVVR